MMKFRSLMSIYVVALLCMLTLAGSALLSPSWGVKAQDKANEGEARKLEGTWRAQITLRVCQTGAEIRSFPALATFARGGTMNSTAAGASPARVSADYGV